MLDIVVLIIEIVSTIYVVLIAKVVSIIIVLTARIVFAKDISITFKNIVIVLIVRFVPAKVLFVSILFVNIKSN